jgi:hypothetical protein
MFLEVATCLKATGLYFIRIHLDISVAVMLYCTSSSVMCLGGKSLREREYEKDCVHKGG